MPPVFVFVKEVEQLLKEGKQEILLPEDAKITPAALDLLQDNGIHILRRGTTEPLPAEPTAKHTGHSADKKTASSAQPEDMGPAPISEEELEVIIERVMKRLGRPKDDPKPEAVEGQTPVDDDDMIICRCEEITKGEIKAALQNGMRTLKGIKRVTRAGMGLCQGQTCQRLVSQILVNELGVSPSEVEPVTARAPVRPVRLSILATG